MMRKPRLRAGLSASGLGALRAARAGFRSDRAGPRGDPRPAGIGVAPGNPPERRAPRDPRGWPRSPATPQEGPPRDARGGGPNPPPPKPEPPGPRTPGCPPPAGPPPPNPGRATPGGPNPPSLSRTAIAAILPRSPTPSRQEKP